MMSDAWILECFKESFLSKTGSQPLEIEDIKNFLVMARALVLLFKAELPQVPSLTMLAIMTNIVDGVPQSSDQNK